MHFDLVSLSSRGCQVKKIMNQVFQFLRGEFELEEFYSGRTVLGTIMNTIKVQPAVVCVLAPLIIQVPCAT